VESSLEKVGTSAFLVQKQVLLLRPVPLHFV
jgi:hypothetical protein